MSMLKVQFNGHDAFVMPNTIMQATEKGENGTKVQYSAFGTIQTIFLANVHPNVVLSHMNGRSPSVSLSDPKTVEDMVGQSRPYYVPGYTNPRT